MLWVGAVLAIQLACAVHIIRSGRNSMWLMLVMFLPLAGSAIYFIMEVLPGMQGNRHVRTAKAKAVAKLDPERDLRAAKARLEIADSAHNRIEVADALGGLGRHEEAIPLYRDAIARTPGGDDRTKAKLARALFETGDAAGAEALLGELPEPAGIGERDRLTMLRARILERQDHIGEALALYEDLVTRYPGEEARCRLAALLLQTGQRDRARLVLEDVEKRAARLDRQQRAAESDMYDWAAAQLEGLRAG